MHSIVSWPAICRFMRSAADIIKKVKFRLFEKITAAFLVFIYTIIIGTTGINAQVSTPDKIRIGLYFEASALANFVVSAVCGLQVGFLQGEDLISLYEEPGKNNITILKDSYFTSNGSGLKEYNPNATPIPDGKKIGPYHIKIGENYSDYTTLMQMVQLIRQAGIPAYPVYADAWQVWTGSYTDANSAQTDLKAKIKPIVGDINYSVVLPASNRIAVQNSAGETVAIFAGSTTALRITPRLQNNPFMLKINSRNYRGCIEVRRLTGSDMTVINILKFEEYLYGVVPGEIEAYSKPEALKAQAVAARTYALGNIGRHGNLGFDLCNTTNCQVYAGYDREQASTNAAVDNTKGLKVTYKGKLAKVYYFSSSGGYTESVVNVWGSDIPYLISVPDNYESGTSANYNWQKILTAAKIKEIMDSRKFNLGAIIDVQTVQFSPAGSVLELAVKGTLGERVYRRDDCRGVFSFNSQKYKISTDADVSARGAGEGTVSIRSAGRKVITADGIKAISSVIPNVKILGAGGQTKTVPTVPVTFIFTGKGYGHSVGMSQEGAKGMAQNGFTFDQILKYYFTGTEVE